jgi:hypothetical protein
VTTETLRFPDSPPPMCRHLFVARGSWPAWRSGSATTERVFGMTELIHFSDDFYRGPGVQHIAVSTTLEREQDRRGNL